MREYFYIEGHRAKTDYEVEDTLILDDQHAYGSEERALAKAREHFSKNKDLGLVVIYKGVKLGDRYGIKYIFRDKDGQLEEIDSWWGDVCT